MKIQELNDKMKAVRAEIKEKALDAMREFFTEYFADTPNVASVTWTQCTPSFNDGEPCVFSADLSYADGVSVEGDDINPWGRYNNRSKWYDVADSIDDEVLLAAFGDGMKVTATRGGFETEEYYDY